jgi:hypothetical protein
MDSKEKTAVPSGLELRGARPLFQRTVASIPGRADTKDNGVKLVDSGIPFRHLTHARNSTHFRLPVPTGLQQALVTNVGLDDELVAEATLDLGYSLRRCPNDGAAWIARPLNLYAKALVGPNSRPSQIPTVPHA